VCGTVGMGGGGCIKPGMGLSRVTLQRDLVGSYELCKQQNVNIYTV
jgi:hypothetical protein